MVSRRNIARIVVVTAPFIGVLSLWYAIFTHGPIGFFVWVTVVFAVCLAVELLSNLERMLDE